VKVFSKGRLGAVLAMSVMMLIAAQPAFAATAKFGAKLGSGTFPSNSYPGTYCDHEIDGGSDTYACTWILLNSFGGGSVTAPKNGKISKVKFVAGAAGSFKLVIARKNASGQFKVTAASAKINYGTDNCLVNCVTRTVTLSSQLNVSTGDYVGVQGAKIGTLRCDSGGNKIALLKPPAPVGGSYVTPTDYSGCFLLVTAVYAS
jgi:hypothetical protein